MGRIITVISPERRTGKSTLIYMLLKHLLNLSNDHGGIQILCINTNHGDLLEMNNVVPNRMSFEDIVNFKMHTDTGIEYKSVLPNKGNIFYLQSDASKQLFIKKHINTYNAVLDEFRNCFDLVIIDTDLEKENILTDLAIEKSDCIMQVINQDIDTLKDIKLHSNKQNVLVVNRYADIFPECKDLSSMLRPDKIYTLPYCATLQQMKNKGKLDLYIQHETEYNKGVSELAENIVEFTGIETPVTAEKSKHRRLLSLLRR